MPTIGTLTQLAPDGLAEVLADVGAAIDAMGGSFTVGYTTVVVTAARTGSGDGPAEQGRGAEAGSTARSAK
jgi:hypothetical protein